MREAYGETIVKINELLLYQQTIHFISMSYCLHKYSYH